MTVYTSSKLATVLPSSSTVTVFSCKVFKVIQGHTRSYNFNQGHSRSHKVKQLQSRSFKVIQCHTTSFKVIQGHTRSYNFIQIHSRSYKVMLLHVPTQNDTKCYWGGCKTQDNMSNSRVLTGPEPSSPTCDLSSATCSRSSTTSKQRPVDVVVFLMAGAIIDWHCLYRFYCMMYCTRQPTCIACLVTKLNAFYYWLQSH